MKKKLLTILLSVFMITGVFTTNVFADLALGDKFFTDNSFTNPSTSYSGKSYCFTVTSLEPLEVKISSSVGRPSGNINIPENVSDGSNAYAITSVSEDAFCGNSDLTGVTLPSTITSIGDNAFCDCTDLTNISITSVTIPTLGSNVFSNCNDSLKISVPDLKALLYVEDTDWSNYKDKILVVVKDLISFYPSYFPTSESGAWLNENNAKVYIYDSDNIRFTYDGTDNDLLSSTAVNLSGNDFACTTGDGTTYTFHMIGNVLDYITVSSNSKTEINGDYGKHDLIISKSDGTAQKGTDYIWEGKTLNIKKSGLTISGTSSKEAIRIPSASNASEVTFKDLTLTSTVAGSALFQNDSSSDITINVVGTNTISNDGAPAFFNNGHKTTFSGEGDLTIKSITEVGMSGNITLNMTGNFECISENVYAIQTVSQINVASNIGKIVLRGGEEEIGAVQLSSPNPFTNIFNLADGIEAFGSASFEATEDNISSELYTVLSPEGYYLSLDAKDKKPAKSVIIKKANDNEPSPGPSSTPDPTPSYKIPNTGVEGTPTNNHSLLKLSSLSLLAIGTYMVIKKKKDN